ncbi:carbohydrate ABC transporter permease [Anaerocolumna sp. AGMB13020]|uniref:carbohydrate ABC transporter permease n=1 Tax=Anaerocolumna sp. AGMB13020 TaxID=3081750 RepID=UPI0029544B75|nr:carbohydrate ABC transporter permease [Anaerocolumna sp. AGMB13020]WOO37801.1 carbohydrate ABC transporter permease [Anaerocolumna sp. AGMB13020]
MFGKKKEAESDYKLNRISKPTNFIFNIIFVIGAAVAIIPFLFVIMISVSSKQSIAAWGYRFIPKEFSLDAYMFLWNEKDTIFNAFGISLLVTILGTIIGLILTSSMGYVLSRAEYKLKGFLTWVVFIPMIFGGGMVASYVVNLNLLHLKDSIWALILPLAVSSYNVVICKTFFKTSIPDSIVEAAKIDGANQLSIYTRVILPISKPLLATIGLFLSFGYWNDWFQSSLYINKSNLMSLQAILNNIQKNVEFLATNPSAGLSIQEYKNLMPTESARMAIAVLIVVPIACAYPFFQRYFVSGLTIGSVKG